MPSVMDKFMQVMETSMTKMDKGMAAAPMTGDVDHDFRHDDDAPSRRADRHGQGGAELRKRPVMCRLAEEIIVDQQSEIDAMNLWLSKKH